MKFLAAILFALSSSAHAYDLAGKWLNREDGTVINFTRVGGEYHQHSTVQYRYSNGLPAYTISQVMTAPIIPGRTTLEATVSFFDSRGCSFKGLPAIFEFQNFSTLNVLMTVPRYEARGCVLLDYVNVPVELQRL